MIGSGLTIASAALTLLFGLVYLIRPKFMSYHKMALQKDWDELEPGMRTLILALMRAVGSGLIAASVAMIILQLEFNYSHHVWCAWTILGIGTFVTAGSLYAMLLVRTRTKGRPPIIALLIIFLILLTGFFFNILT